MESLELGPNSQNFKVLCFGPNFRGVLFMSSMDIVWDYFLQKNPQTDLFIIWVSFKPLPRFQVMSIQAVPNPVKSSLIFWVLSPKYPIIHTISSHSNWNPRKSILWCRMSLLLRSSAIWRVFPGHWSSFLRYAMPIYPSLELHDISNSLSNFKL